jgi:hypothetical protein
LNDFYYINMIELIESCSTELFFWYILEGPLICYGSQSLILYFLNSFLLPFWWLDQTFLHPTHQSNQPTIYPASSQEIIKNILKKENMDLVQRGFFWYIIEDPLIYYELYSLILYFLNSFLLPFWWLDPTQHTPIHPTK